MSDDLLAVENLTVSFPTPRGRVEVVKGISFSLRRERLGIVGESGSGKSMTGRAILRLVRPPGRVTADLLHFSGIDLIGQLAQGLIDQLGLAAGAGGAQGQAAGIEIEGGGGQGFAIETFS